MMPMPMPMPMPRRLRRIRASHRGQSGLTIIEMLFVITIGTLVLIPMFGLISQTLLFQKPAVNSADSSKQLRLFRSKIQEDWGNAKVIKAGLGLVPASTECNRGPFTAFNSGITILIAIQTSSGPNPNTATRRIIYSTRLTPSTTDDPLAKDIIRRECSHVSEPLVLTPGGPPDLWNTGGLWESAVILISGVKDLRLDFPPNKSCNVPRPTFPQSQPYLPCDVNVTLTALDDNTATPSDADNQKSTVRLRQHTGYDS
jgi:hypothetical protein